MTNRTPLTGGAVLAACVIAAGTPAVAHGQQATLRVDAASDSVIATGIPVGATTAQVTRPDARTGAPVVIGQYVEVASILPFTINTTTPTIFDPDGDCWHAGALPLPTGTGLTPDIRAGDTVALSSGLSTVVPPGPEPTSGGPATGCGDITTYAHNAVTELAGGSGADLVVRGVAQPLATDVTVTATDGRRTTTPVAATLADDGTWTATLPRQDLAPLADGTVTVAGVYAVPDVSTAAPAHIAGVPATFTQRSPREAPPVGEPSPPPPSPPAAAPPQAAPPAVQEPLPPIVRVRGVRAPSRVTLARARARGLRVSFDAPAEAKVIRVQLARGGGVVLTRVVAAVPGRRQAVALTGKQLRRVLRRGRHTLSVAAGPSRSAFGPATDRTLRVR